MARYLISEAARQTGVEAHVLRYWEEELELDEDIQEDEVQDQEILDESVLEEEEAELSEDEEEAELIED